MTVLPCRSGAEQFRVSVLRCNKLVRLGGVEQPALSVPPAHG